MDYARRVRQIVLTLYRLGEDDLFYGRNLRS